ncbi:hypothetical protein LTR95_003679 [Oleoguttula sp. CCFEE 5521]
MSGAPDDPRTARLRKLLNSYVNGDRTVKTANEGKLYFEAIVTEDDAVACIERVSASKNALAALRLALRFDVTPTFFNTTFSNFVRVLCDPALAATCGGELLKRILTIIVQPPTVWNALLAAHQEKQLSPEAEITFAWLLLELASWTVSPPVDVDQITRDITQRKVFLNAEDRELRTLGYRIHHVLQTKATLIDHDGPHPGGRHDNDHADFRKISIFPTDDELTSVDVAFYRSANAITTQPPNLRPAIHLDNQFRLLREDLLAELREDVKARGKSGSKRRARMSLQGLALVGIFCGDTRFKTACSLKLMVRGGLGPISRLSDVDQRKAFLKNNPKFLKHQSFGCVLDQDRIIAFATLHRDEALLTQDDPLVVLRTPDRASLEKLLSALQTSETAEFVMVDTPAFAYEPVLRCLQMISRVPLSHELLCAGDEVKSAVRFSPVVPRDFITDLIAMSGPRDFRDDLQEMLSLPQPVHLDDSQLQSLLAGLRQTVSLIQGPPGTGKSFIGALLSKALVEHSSEKILVICYTNHALDQFLEALLDVGIPGDGMVRLGSKSTARTAPLQLSNQTTISGHSWQLINPLKDQVIEHESKLEDLVLSLLQFRLTRAELMQHLEFSDDDADYLAALQTPFLDLGERLVAENGKHVTQGYLYDRWRHGNDAGVFRGSVLAEHAHIWSMDGDSRHQKIAQWKEQIQQERIQAIGSLAEAYNEGELALREAWGQRDRDTIGCKRIIACTTTAAAMYTKQLRSAAPGIVMVEEAGEILESHILTALTPSTKQLILIGDHKQLRPKINNYALTVEKGEGFDLNRSLFERLILAGYPHTTLHQQHRMCPEISEYVRHLTYPDLTDAPSTLTRKALRGLCSRMTFIDHRKPELAAMQVADRRDEGTSVSKENEWESSMILKIVRYLAQQGYGTADQVVLTPYLGQLSRLRQELSAENDPVLNDLDSFDLINAGLMTSPSAAQVKRPLRLSTIDNYQGEESEVVIASLTRSNSNGDIGFMVSPERLNVLLSRARSCLIIIGNSETFLTSKKGKSTWRPFFDMLAENNKIYDGLPAKCEQHPEREVILAQPSDFDELCPDGGCSAPCGVTLRCGLHNCPRKCHVRADHTKVFCQSTVSDHCPKNHIMKWRCSGLRPASCLTCDAADRTAERLRKRDEALDQARQSKQAAYARQLAEIQDEIDHAQRIASERREDTKRERALQQRRIDLEKVHIRFAREQQSKSAAVIGSVPSPDTEGVSVQQGSTTDPTSSDDDAHVISAAAYDPPMVISEAQADWQYQREFENAQSDELDELMSMIGLEAVKGIFLSVKAKVDLAVRQGISLSNERFGISLLGNPGTGKTTVARLYGRFLASVGALPGNEFLETTGAKLAHEGVQGCKKILDDLVNKGGGALFIDEAYQLTSGSSFGGGAVIDYLLAEVENLTGKVVFILAGYDRDMESFFTHNPGLPSRFPTRAHFVDYEDNELLNILVYRLQKKYGPTIQVDDGIKGLYARIVARRVGRGRGKAGFGNARAVENVVSIIASRQASRIKRDRRQGTLPNDMLLTREDLIGPNPSEVLSNNKTWRKLQGMTGLTSVKDSITALFDSIKYNYQREIEENPLLEFSLNKVFLGSPGTGKTTVAKLYGRILADIGLLSTNEVVLKTPADFVGNVLGASEANTKAILDAARGKVLVIDEAYGLYSASDPYKAAVIDTIVAEVQSVPGDDRCVLLLGYREQLEDMMQNVNPGLARRFPIDSGFLFEDFSDDELAFILDAKLKAQVFVATPSARKVALDVLSRMRNRPNFGNAGAIDIVLNDAKLRQQKRFARDKVSPSNILEAEDFDLDHKRAERAITNLARLFSGVVGCESIVNQLQDYQNIATNMRDLGMDPRDNLPCTFLFRGPPGTGKTTTARKMGKVYYDMGFLADAQVIECSAKDLVGEYVGQTGPKAQKLIQSALGKVLFIDEAYRLGDGAYGKEAADELVDCITKPHFLNKLVIILAGYDSEINRLLDVNPGLSSRFAESVDFKSLNPEACLELLTVLLVRETKIDMSLLSAPDESLKTQILDRFAELAALSNFANGRDIQTLGKGIIRTILKGKKKIGGALVLTKQIILDQMHGLISERLARAESASRRSLPQATGGALSLQMKTRQRPGSGQASAFTNAVASAAPTVAYQDQQPATESSIDNAPDPEGCPSTIKTAKRDIGVSDAVWAQLQADVRKGQEEQAECLRLVREEEELVQWLRKCADAKRQQELEDIRRRKLELEEKLASEEAEQAKLAKMGRCPVGYRWIRQSGGYRCAGGSHWVSDGEMEKLCQ